MPVAAVFCHVGHRFFPASSWRGDLKFLSWSAEETASELDGYPDFPDGLPGWIDFKQRPGLLKDSRRMRYVGCQCGGLPVPESKRRYQACRGNRVDANADAVVNSNYQ